jgi:hypothetical protein
MSVCMRLEQTGAGEIFNVLTLIFSDDPNIDQQPSSLWIPGMDTELLSIL